MGNRYIHKSDRIGPIAVSEIFRWIVRQTLFYLALWTKMLPIYHNDHIFQVQQDTVLQPFTAEPGQDKAVSQAPEKIWTVTTAVPRYTAAAIVLPL